jgi:hypothetical protein
VRIELDLTTVPPTATLADVDDFERFEVVAAPVSHVFVPVEELRRLAGERAGDPAWEESLEGMVAYARSKDWLDENGAIRAHVEWRT